LLAVSLHGISDGDMDTTSYLRGCEEIGLHLGDDAVGRCLLLTDGLANAGVTDPDEIVRRVSALRSRRIATSAFGLGADFDEFLLSRMAEAGGVAPPRALRLAEAIRFLATAAAVVH
jgi:Ca-activated chloride channel family protein